MVHTEAAAVVTVAMIAGVPADTMTGDLHPCTEAAADTGAAAEGAPVPTDAADTEEAAEVAGITGPDPEATPHLVSTVPNFSPRNLMAPNEVLLSCLISDFQAAIKTQYLVQRFLDAKVLVCYT